MKDSAKPLFGKQVLVTRARRQASELVRRIKELGGSVLEFPVIEIVPPHDMEPMDEAIRNLTDFDWIIFTSGNGAESFFSRWRETTGEPTAIKVKTAVVGPKTAEVVRHWGIEPDLIARDYKAEGLLEMLSPMLTGRNRILFPRSSLARPMLTRELLNRGHQVTEIDAYHTIQAADKVENILSALEEKKIDFITFTSSSTVKNFCEVIPREMLHPLLYHVDIVCIGPITAQTAMEYELEVTAVADEHTIAGLVAALIKVSNE